MALSDLKTVTLTKKELLVLEELMVDYANSDGTYSFRIDNDVEHTEEQMEELFFKLSIAARLEENKMSN